MAPGATSHIPRHHPSGGRIPTTFRRAAPILLASSFFATLPASRGHYPLRQLLRGRRSQFQRLVCGTIRSVLQGQPVIIRSDGTPKRDYIYIKDAVSAYTILAETA